MDKVGAKFRTELVIQSLEAILYGGFDSIAGRGWRQRPGIERGRRGDEWKETVGVGMPGRAAKRGPSNVISS
jgi:hypothetical protein